MRGFDPPIHPYPWFPLPCKANDLDLHIYIFNALGLVSSAGNSGLFLFPIVVFFLFLVSVLSLRRTVFVLLLYFMLLFSFVLVPFSFVFSVFCFIFTNVWFSMSFVSPSYYFRLIVVFCLFVILRSIS